MRIVVNDIAASTGGAMVVLRDFYHCVCENDTENEWIFLLADKYFEETDNVKIIPMPHVKKSGVSKLMFDYVTGRKFIASLHPDVVFSLQNIVTFGLKVPQVVYVHQSLPFQKVKNFSFFKSNERVLALYQYVIGSVIKSSIKKSDRVIVQTAWMKDAVCEQCAVPAEKVWRVLPQVQPIAMHRDAVWQKHRFFYPTADYMYKNNDLIFDACEMLNQKGLEYEVVLTATATRECANVRCVGHLPYEEILKRYQTDVLLFPSYIETFGYPLAEARQAGTIVLASDTAFSREVLEGYPNAYFFDPFRPQELADLMERVLGGELVRQDVPAAPTAQPDSWAEVMDIVRRTV